MGPTGGGSQRPRPFRRQFPGRPALPSGQNPPAGSSRGNCCLGSGHPATWVPGMRLGGRAGAYLGSVCSGPSRRDCTSLGTGEGAALGGGLAGKAGAMRGSREQKTFLLPPARPRSSGWAAPGSWLELQVLRSFPRPAVQNLHFNKIFG